MSQLDSAMSSLYASMLAPTASTASPGLVPELMRRQRGVTATAKTSPMQPSPATSHLIQAPRDGASLDTPAATADPAYSRQQQLGRDQAALTHARMQIAQAKAGAAPGGYDPSTGMTGGVSLGDQAEGGRNVELIRGGQSSVQHFNEQGDNQGDVHAANSMQAGVAALPKAMGYDDAQTQHFNSLIAAGFKPHEAVGQINHEAARTKPVPFHEANAEDLHDLKMAQHDYDHADKKLDPLHGIPPSDPGYPAALAERDAAHQRIQAANQNIKNRLHPPAPGTPTSAPPAAPNLAQSILHGPQAQALAAEMPQLLAQQQQGLQSGNQIPRPPHAGAKITPDVVAAIGQLVGKGPGASKKAEELARQAGWSF